MPIALYVLFVMALFPILVHWIGGYLRYKQFGYYDNRHPRQQQSQLTGVGARAMGAQANSWETLQIYTAVLFIAYAAGVDLARLDLVSILFLVLRVIYVALYLMDLAALRSIVYSLGLFCCIYIFGVAVAQVGG